MKKNVKHVCHVVKNALQVVYGTVARFPKTTFRPVLDQLEQALQQMNAMLGQPFKAVIVPKARGNPSVVSCAVQRGGSPGLANSRTATIMRAIGRKCGWVIPRKERRVLALLRTHTCERDYGFVTESPGNPGRKPIRMKVDFAQERLSAFEPAVQVLTNTDALAA